MHVLGSATVVSHVGRRHLVAVAYPPQTPNYILDPIADMPADFGPELPENGIEAYLRVGWGSVEWPHPGSRHTAVQGPEAKWGIPTPCNFLGSQRLAAMAMEALVTGQEPSCGRTALALGPRLRTLPRRPTYHARRDTARMLRG